MATASKKSVSKANYVFDIKPNEIIEQQSFGSFEVIKTKRGIMFKNYVGYHVWTTPYAVGTDGKAHETSLYSWLNELLALNKQFKGHGEEPLSDGQTVTKGDLLKAVKRVTEANLTRPMVVFINRDYAFEEAQRHEEWMIEQVKALQKASTETPPEEDEKANAEFNAKAEVGEIMNDMLKEVEANAGKGE